MCVGAQASTVANYNVEKVGCLKMPAAKLAAIFFFAERVDSVVGVSGGVSPPASSADKQAADRPQPVQFDQLYLH